VLLGDSDIGETSPLESPGIGDSIDGGDDGLVDIRPPARTEYSRAFASIVGSDLRGRHRY
jgi:hypothetical protein